MSLPQINKILYTTSLGPYTRAVYRYAVQIAQQNDAELIMLHVMTPVGELGEALIRQYLPADLVKQVQSEGIGKITDQMHTRVQQFYDEELRELEVDVAVQVTPMVVEGDHDEAILRVANQQDVDLIVMGTEHKLGLHSQSHTTQKVIKRSRVPVYVVPTGKEYQQ